MNRHLLAWSLTAVLTGMLGSATPLLAKPTTPPAQPQAEESFALPDGIEETTSSKRPKKAQPPATTAQPIPLSTPEPSAPQAPAAYNLIGVVPVDKNGAWSPRHSLCLDFSQLKDLNSYIFFWKDLFRPEAVAKLSDKQLVFLMSNPFRLLASSYVSQILRPDCLVFLNADGSEEKNSRYTALKVDLATSSKESYLAPTGMTAEQSNAFLLKYCHDGQAPIKEPVIANISSSTFHKPDAQHLHQDAQTKFYNDRSQAEKAGFRPCPVCFDDANHYTSHSKEERKQSARASKDIEDSYRISQDQVAIERVNKVAAKVLAANELSVTDYRVIVLDSDEMNSFSAPTGPIYITSGFLNALETDDEIAAVIGHELAHVKYKHTEKRSSTRNYANVLGDVLGYATGNYWLSLGTRAAGSLYNKTTSRSDVYQADDVALYMSYAAGYRPDDFELTLTKLGEVQAKANNSSVPNWFSSSPDPASRLANVKRIIADIQRFEARLAPVLQVQDTGLANCLRRNAQGYMKAPGDLDSFLAAYSLLQLNGSQNKPTDAPINQEAPGIR